MGSEYEILNAKSDIEELDIGEIYNFATATIIIKIE